MSVRNDQCKKVCKILDDALANRPSERDTLIVAVQKAFKALTDDGWIPCEDGLPEDEYVLISKKPAKISGSKWSVAIAIRTADSRSRKIQWRDSGFGVIQDDKVLAWMPLPPAYEPKEDK